MTAAVRHPGRPAPGVRSAAASRTTRTNSVIDEALIREAMEAGGFKTKRQAVEAGLRLLAQQKHYRYIRSRRGKLKREGNLEATRRDR